MRNLKARFANQPIAIDENVEVECTRSVANARRTVASKFFFNCQKTFE